MAPAKAISDVLCSAQRACPGSEEGGLLLNCPSLELKIPLVFIPVRTDVALHPVPVPYVWGRAGSSARFQHLSKWASE